MSIDEDDDNWDDDFASIISPSALQLPRTKLVENRLLGVSQSSDRLKTFASNDGANESWDDNFEGDLTVKSSSSYTSRVPDAPLQ